MRVFLLVSQWRNRRRRRLWFHPRQICNGLQVIILLMLLVRVVQPVLVVMTVTVPMWLLSPSVRRREWGMVWWMAVQAVQRVWTSASRRWAVACNDWATMAAVTTPTTMTMTTLTLMDKRRILGKRWIWSMVCRCSVCSTDTGEKRCPCSSKKCMQKNCCVSSHCNEESTSWRCASPFITSTICWKIPYTTPSSNSFASCLIPPIDPPHHHQQQCYHLIPPPLRRLLHHRQRKIPAVVIVMAVPMVFIAEVGLVVLEGRKVPMWVPTALFAIIPAPKGQQPQAQFQAQGQALGQGQA